MLLSFITEMSEFRASSFSAGLSPAIVKTLTNTFITVGGMLAITAVAAYLSLGIQFGALAFIALIVAMFGLIIALRKAATSPLGLVVLAALSAVMGISFGPMLTRYLAMPNGASLVATAAGLTALTAFTCAVVAATSKHDFSKMRAFLLAGTIALIVASLVGIFVQIPALHLTISVVGALIFTAWLLHDVQAVIRGSESNYIVAACGIYLDLLNIFNFLLSILGITSRD